MYFQICTVVWRSPISALQVGMVENVKFNHEFALFFAHILLKNDTVHFNQYLVPRTHLMRLKTTWFNIYKVIQNSTLINIT